MVSELCHKYSISAVFALKLGVNRNLHLCPIVCCVPRAFYSCSTVTMPSDLAKKKAAKKKEAAKARQRPKKAEEVNGEGEKPESQENGVSEFNGESEALNTQCPVHALLRVLVG